MNTLNTNQIQKLSTLIPKAIHQHGITEKAKIIWTALNYYCHILKPDQHPICLDLTSCNTGYALQNCVIRSDPYFTRFL